jgi:hypothetical protein
MIFSSDRDHGFASAANLHKVSEEDQLPHLLLELERVESMHA